MTGGHNGCVMLMVKGSTAKVSHADAGVLHRLLLTALRGEEGEPGQDSVLVGKPSSGVGPCLPFTIPCVHCRGFQTQNSQTGCSLASSLCGSVGFHVELERQERREAD